MSVSFSRFNNMHIDGINLFTIRLPFVDNFSHAKKKGAFAHNVIVEITADRFRFKGYGEAAPRIYVTGESPESAMQSIGQFVRHDHFPWELEDITQIWDFVDILPEGKKHNSAICALEMALLDVLGKCQNMPILEYFPKTHYTDTICYGAAVHLGDKERIIKICRLIQQLGIRHLRIKLDDDFQNNKCALETVISFFGQVSDLRVDVNGAWDSELAHRHIQLLKDAAVKVVEQPLHPDASGLSEFAGEMKAHGIILMADESACSYEDIKKIKKDGDYEMINVRLSKCGGFRRSLEIIDRLRAGGLYFQIGCQLGESGLLSAAGRVLSLLNRDALFYDGSYDAFLLKENTTDKNVTFGPGGIAGPINGSGLGVTVNRRRLARLNSGHSAETISRI